MDLSEQFWNAGVRSTAAVVGVVVVFVTAVIGCQSHCACYGRGS